VRPKHDNAQGVTNGGSLSANASTINYRVSSYDDYWIYYPIIRWKPEKTKIKIDPETRTISVHNANKYKVEYHLGGSDLMNGGRIKLHIRADLDRGFEWDPVMTKAQPMPRLKIFKKPLA